MFTFPKRNRKTIRDQANIFIPFLRPSSEKTEFIKRV